MPVMPCRQHGIHFLILSFGMVLLLAASRMLFHLDYTYPSSPLQAKPELTTTSSATLNSIAIPFGSTAYSVNFSTPVIRSNLAKRAPSRTFEEARCQGAAFWARIQETYRNPSKPGPQFSFSDLDAAWEHNVPDERYREPPDGFIPFFDQVVQGGVTHDRINRTVMAQKSPYRDRLGRQQVSHLVHGKPSLPHTQTTLLFSNHNNVIQKPEVSLTSGSAGHWPPTTPSTSAPPPPSSPSILSALSTSSSASESRHQRPTPSARTSIAGPICSGTSGATCLRVTIPPTAPSIN